MQTELAPIVIPVYKRLEHLKKCINSLLANELAASTVLYIFSDHPFAESDKDAINELRAHLKSLNGFKQVIIKEQTVNKRLGNIQEAITSTLQLHPTIIYLEEDLEVSRNFLSFMNEQLRLYQEDANVFSIAGYGLPCFANDKDHILGSTSFTAWGCGLWRDKYDEMENFFKKESLLTRLRIFKTAVTYIQTYGFGSYIQVRKKLMNSSLTPDLTIGSYLWLTNKIQLFPTRSLVKTNGFDGSGWHCDSLNKFTGHIHESELKDVKKVELTQNHLAKTLHRVIYFHELGLSREFLKVMKRPNFYIRKFLARE